MFSRFSKDKLTKKEFDNRNRVTQSEINRWHKTYRRMNQDQLRADIANLEHSLEIDLSQFDHDPETKTYVENNTNAIREQLKIARMYVR